MSILPRPTNLELQLYRQYESKPKYVIKYKKIYLTDDKVQSRFEIKHFGMFTSEDEARTYFAKLPKFYVWKRQHYAMKLLDVLNLEDFKKQNKKKGKK